MKTTYGEEIFLKDDTLITSKTDLKGKITYGNSDFIKYGEYTESEFLNKPHNLIRHSKMPRTAFKLLWDTLANKNEFFAFVCNLSKTGKTYWVFANITPSYDENGKAVADLIANDSDTIDLTQKFRYIAESEGRSANKEIEQFLKKRVADFERENGTIPVNTQKTNES